MQCVVIPHNTNSKVADALNSKTSPKGCIFFLLTCEYFIGTPSGFPLEGGGNGRSMHVLDLRRCSFKYTLYNCSNHSRSIFSTRIFGLIVASNIRQVHRDFSGSSGKCCCRRCEVSFSIYFFHFFCGIETEKIFKYRREYGYSTEIARGISRNFRNKEEKMTGIMRNKIRHGYDRESG